MDDINVDWLRNLKKKIDAIPDCKALNKLIEYLREKFQELIEDILNQIAKMVGLIIPPTSLAKVIRYLRELATRYLGPYLAAIRQLIRVIRAFAEVLQAIQNKLANLHCSISAASIINQLKTDLTSVAYRRLYSGNSTLPQLLDIAQRLRNGVPPLEIIANRFGVNIQGLPAIAMQYGGTLPFMRKMLDVYQPAAVPPVPPIPTIVTPTEITLENPAPTIDNLSTNFGAIAGGTVVTLTGTGFLEGVTVTIGDITCDNIELVDDTTITFSSPALSPGLPYDVVVTNNDGQSATLVGGFNVIG